MMKKRTDITEEYLLDRIWGSLIGGALGDALGYEVEFINWTAIKQEFGKKGITELVTHGGNAIFSDDTQMTLFTVGAMIDGYKRRALGQQIDLTADCIYDGYLAWLQTQGYVGKGRWNGTCSELRDIPELNKQRAPGNTCLNALTSGRMGTPENPVNSSKGCGGVMRTAPLGFTDDWGSPLLGGARAGAVTHGHPGGWIPSGMIAEIVYRGIYQDEDSLEQIILASLDSVLKTWGELEETEDFAGLIRRAVRLSHEDISDVKAIHSLGGGWTGDEALAIAVYSSLKHRDDPVAALICAANHSGDSDSTAAITGNIMGAFLGGEAIPQEWICRIEQLMLIRQMSEELSALIYSGGDEGE